ncbi:hypothetical protein BJX66DRAFT_336811 [Aspergillus keveii]|uniref:Homeobox and C2H2 transcription factor n=1 Tax=Aspergillus keveii TaxID=714993 RepID=A0ABR4G8V4_9EURO
MQSQQVTGSGLILPCVQREDIQFDATENLRETDAPPFYPSSTFFAGQSLEEDDCRSAVELSDSCSSWFSFLHTDFLGESEVSDNILQRLSESSTTAQKAPKRTPRTRLSASAVKILRTWFEQHRDDPYPTDIDKEILARRSSLTLTQVSNWFNNARRSKGRVSRARQQCHDKVNRDASCLSPLERWKNSPPETEAAATSDIIRALEEHASSSLYNDGAIQPPCLLKDLCSSNSSSASLLIPKALSADIFEHSQSSGSDLDFKSNVEARYQRPPTPVPSRRRRNRVRPFKKLKGQGQGPRPYQCTFCADSFPTKYDWQRHEKALHLPVDRWVCAPRGSVLELEDDNNGNIKAQLCVFCRALYPTPEHLARHNFFTCYSKPIDERLFFRKDHLKQHLKLTHNASWLPSMEAWLDTRNAIVSRCGFCSATFSAWDERVEHIAEHFKAGAKMAQWKGDWGFEPEVEKEVQNAMPPYLLGYEQNTMDPWRMTDNNNNNNNNTARGRLVQRQQQLGDEESPPLHETNINTPNALSKYTSLRQELVAYIRTQLAANVYPSDVDLQNMARLIAYGDTDRCNQTYADDPAWLITVKQEAGLDICE